MTASGRIVRLARADDSDGLNIKSDEFLVRMLDGNEVSVRDYRCVDPPVTGVDAGTQVVTIRYRPREALPAGSPDEIIVEYRLSESAYLRKRLRVFLPKGGAVVRLEVER